MSLFRKSSAPVAAVRNVPADALADRIAAVTAAKQAATSKVAELEARAAELTAAREAALLEANFEADSAAAEEQRQLFVDLAAARADAERLTGAEETLNAERIRRDHVATRDRLAALRDSKNAEAARLLDEAIEAFRVAKAKIAAARSAEREAARAVREHHRVEASLNGTEIDIHVIVPNKVGSWVEHHARLVGVLTEAGL